MYECLLPYFTIVCYTNVQNMVGGIFEWANEGRPLKDSNGLTKNVHAYNQVWGKWVVKGNKVY
jgi:hypothetical protein